MEERRGTGRRREGVESGVGKIGMGENDGNRKDRRQEGFGFFFVFLLYVTIVARRIIPSIQPNRIILAPSWFV